MRLKLSDLQSVSWESISLYNGFSKSKKYKIRGTMSTEIVNVSLFCIPWSFIIVSAQLEVSLPAPCSHLPVTELFTWKTSNNSRTPHAWPCHYYISYLQTLATNHPAHPGVWQLEAFANSPQKPQTIHTEALITSLTAAYKTRSTWFRRETNGYPL
jgi:hypothetical protein